MRSPTAVKPSKRRKKGVPAELTRLRGLLRRALEGTAELFPAVRAGFGWVHRVAHLLGRKDLAGAQVRQRLRVQLGRMRAEATRAETRGDTALAQGLRHFVKVSGSYEPGLFHA